MKPMYLENSVIFNKTEILLAEIKKYIFIDLLPYNEITYILSNRCGYKIAPAAIAKILKYYKIELSSDIKLARKKYSAKKASLKLKEKYGVVNVFQLESVKQKASETKLKLYGDSKYTNLEKNKQTCLEKYGVTNYSSTKECREKVAKTNLEKYGSVTPAGNIEIQNKMKQTCLEKYGVDNYWKTSVFKKEMQEKYFSENNKLTDLYKEVYQDTEKLKEAVNSMPEKDIPYIASKFGLSYASTYQLLLKHNLLGLVDSLYNRSQYEREIVNFIGNDFNIILNDRSALQGSEIDIYLPDKKLGIEFNGTFWHSSAVKKDKNYHFKKSKIAEENGIRLIHIWEYEWCDPVQQEKIKLLLNIALGRACTKIYARDCIIKQISNKEAKILNDKVHLQNHRNAQITYGLFYKNELVQLMSFSQTKYNKNLKNEGSWEIIRGCPGSNNIVVGGVSKLFKHFVNDYKPKQVFSYCDFNKFNGKSYEALGMSFVGYTGPDMKWLLKSGEVVSRKPSKHRELKEKSAAQLYGAGSKKYIIIIKEL